MKVFLSVLAAVIALVALSLLLPAPGGGGQGDEVVTSLPWQIEPQADGTIRVADLTIGNSTLGDASKRFGKDGELAIVAAPGETGTLELYFPDVTLGVVTGKMIVTADLSDSAVEGMRQRAGKAEYMQSSTKKARLDDTDLPAAYAARIRALAFVPSVHLDEPMVVQRFGQSAERIRTEETVEHLLYPDRGLDIVLDSKGKELLQYVAPRNFAAVRDPLIRTRATPDGNR